MTMVQEHQAGHGLYKSAVLLVSLGSDLAAQVLSQMDDGHVESLIGEMTRLRQVDAVERDRVVEEFTSRVEEAPGEAGGPEYARRVLEQAVGPERARQMLGEESPAESESLSLAGILETTSPESLAALVADDHPQLIALLIGQLS